MKKISIVSISLVIWLIPVFAFAQTTTLPDRVQSLKGLEGVYILVELNEEIKEAGFTDQSVKSDIEKILNNAGVKIIDINELRNTPGNPYLQLSTFGYEMKTGGYACALLLGLKQDVILKRDMEIPGEATTWSSLWEITFSKGNMAHLPETVRNMTNLFVTDYRTANPSQKK